MRKKRKKRYNRNKHKNKKMLKKKRRNVMILDLIFNRVKEEGKERLINEQKVIERIEVKRT